MAVHDVVRPPTTPPLPHSEHSLSDLDSDGTGTTVQIVRWGVPQRARCRGHSSTITAVDWSADSRTLRSTCQGYEILHFDARTGRQAVGDFRDSAWDTWTAPLGFPVMGIYFDGGGMGTDINSVSRASSRGLVATGDDFGLVRLMHYPSVVSNAPANEHSGAHSSHVTCVRFSPGSGGNKWLVSAGGADRGALQWRLVGEDGALLPPLASDRRAAAAAAAAAAVKGGNTEGVGPADAEAVAATAAAAEAEAAAERRSTTFAAVDGVDGDGGEDDVVSSSDGDGAGHYRAVFVDDVVSRRPRETAPLYHKRRMADYRKNRMAELRAQMEASMRAGKPDPRRSVPEVPPPGMVWGALLKDPTGQSFGWVHPEYT